MRFSIIAILIVILIPAAINAQEDFWDWDFGGFGSTASGPSVNTSGEVNAALTGFFDDFSSRGNAMNASLGDIFSGRLNFEASGSAAQAVINLNITPTFGNTSPIEIDEAYLRVFFGHVTITGGLRKLTWGRADSFGPLDIINPIDFRDLTKLSDPASVKIARPMIHAAWSLGHFSRLEAVFVPWFQGDKIAAAGKWTPNQIRNLYPLFDPENFTGYNRSLEYAQAGVRFTTTLGSSDFGFQYYFGRFTRPRVIPRLLPMPPTLDIDYNYFHHIGIDFARVFGAFNVRAEAGANLTSDLDGRDGTVENPSLVWSLGFDRDLFMGLNLNLQGTGMFRLFHDRIGGSIFTDIEAGTNRSSTRITGIISRKFLRDELELKTTGLWGVEDRDFLVMPAIVWSRNDISTELKFGFFGGGRNGELGQYRDNNFVRVSLSYKF